ncbi:hypothetical protein [Corynebacterium kutscheri]|uniref:Secreted protein n=1 Tax=Corynebacterium kutscheri TaxID=35755 RepID=A0AB38VX50_9CORY|nr:hypothetical protein [Corynebacterium kutscheri]VEH06980.1 Uncharacterised protein [Corynebacterium kutscheri]
MLSTYQRKLTTIAIVATMLLSGSATANAQTSSEPNPGVWSSSNQKSYNGEVIGNLQNKASQVDTPNDKVQVSASNGENRTFRLSELQNHANFTESTGKAAKSKLKKPNSCHAYTGFVGITHSTFWGIIVGGPAGIAAAAAVGGFWRGAGAKC